MKTKYYTGLILIIFESIVSGIYTPIDLSWIILRVGLISVYLTAAIVDTKESRNVIAWIPLATIALSLLSVDSKYKSLEAEKLKSVKSDYMTSVKAPTIPALPNCEGLTKWRLDQCQTKTEKLQIAYNESLEKYNSRIIRSESKIEKAKVELTFQEQIPIFIYVLFISGLSFISFASTPKVEKQIEKVESVIEQKDERTKIVNRIIAGRSNLSIAEELGIDRRKIARIKNELGQWQSKARPIGAQSTDKVVSIREIKRGA
jgi:hypothetical protein